MIRVLADQVLTKESRIRQKSGTPSRIDDTAFGTSVSPNGCDAKREYLMNVQLTSDTLAKQSAW